MSATIANLLPIILFFVIFYFLLLRPQQKRQRAIQQMQANLKKGDKIITIGGLHGIIDSVDEDKVVIRAGDGTRLTYDRSAVREVVTEKENK
ncbi:preprotein translocase subunit YajC [Parageobacillus toebii NBRC 107807]|jgi:preprotein translocase subunit YajC|uniref:Preprotein translocase subunit YajC n=1 Tax=Parageobacillus toebii NBRC 107807 TaxID=1223503 RepID=A0A6G9J0R1_9BACL|nr:preprotein translocase subunit YajC [Parageobacillus toebii]MBB3867571.1 preprotein translocase subunit YajC [Parageobacillus toebii NBRC 107807]MED4969554.1 preprotein translocase subunit YajC [Parageobacillus toebii]QIQ31540.1 preprotein translocase subunit YajC [Parageobacillus toebii NBRC 107807]QSB49952.1 preprotein translocase subunit YajC [Parageobacillus toebii]WMT19320.1 preprotein translocase subunit YajC [Parageobacillus toebii]